MELWLRSRPFWQIALGIVVAGLCVYAWSLGNGFVTLDDGLLIYANPAVLELTSRSVWHVFTSYDPELYVPLTLLSYQLEHAVFGLHPTFFHLTSLCLHLGNALLVFWIGMRLTEKRAVGLLAALLFVIHPLNVEAVAWAAARKDVLSGFFCFAAIALFLEWRETGNTTFRRLCTVAFFFGLLAKVSILSLPFLLVAIEWSRRRPIKEAIVEQWPQWLLAVIFGIVAVIGKSHALQASGPLTTLLLACKSTAFYLLNIILPTGLSVIYPQTGPVTLSAPEFVVSIVVVAAFFCLLLFIARRSRALALGLLLFLLALPPNFLNFYKNHALYFGSDRYAYIAGFGVFLFAAMLGNALIARASSRATRGICGACMVMIMVAFGSLAAMQAKTWQDSQSLYLQTLRHYPNSWLAWSNLGQAYAQQNDDAKALEAFQQAEALSPRSPIVLVNMGNVYKRKGNVDEAARLYAQSAQVLSGNAVTDAGDLVGFYYLGELEESRGNPEAALKAFEDAAQAAPMIAEPHYNLALQYQKRALHEQAVQSFQAAVALQGDMIDARYRLAAELAGLGRLEEALTQLEAVQQLRPGYENSTQHLANIKRLLGR